MNYDYLLRSAIQCKMIIYENHKKKVNNTIITNDYLVK